MVTTQRQPTILIVEDDIPIAELIADAIEEETNACVRTLHNGNAAIRHLAEQPVDLVILDYQLPGATGIEVYDAMRRNPHTATTPVLFMTANDRRAEFERRGLAYLRKPFNLFTLLATVTARLDERLARAAAS